MMGQPKYPKNQLSNTSTIEQPKKVPEQKGGQDKPKVVNIQEDLTEEPADRQSNIQNSRSTPINNNSNTISDSTNASLTDGKKRIVINLNNPQTQSEL
jgi:hypothetical protein